MKSITAIVYIACPYADPDPAVRRARVHIANRVAGVLSGHEFRVFNPLGHSQGIVDNGGSTDHEYWMDLNKAMLGVSAAMVVLTVDGWDNSRGVKEEVAIASEAGLPIYFLEPIVLESNTACVVDHVRRMICKQFAAMASVA